MTDHTVYFGDAEEVLASLEAETVDTCITSPAYFHLRDYGAWKVVRRWDPEGRNDPDLLASAFPVASSKWRKRGLRRRELELRVRAWLRGGLECPKTGGRMDALGAEPTPELYVRRLVLIFRQVWRVLKPEGTVWLNLGDTYASGKGTCFNPGGGEDSLGQKRKEAGVHPLDRGSVTLLRSSGLKPKDLIGIPWRVALALQANGWWLRNDCIQAKGNAMPESVKDRFTNTHEHWFLFAKQERYFFDLDAVRQEHADESKARFERAMKLKGRIGDTQTEANKYHSTGMTADGLSGKGHGLGRNPGDVLYFNTKPFSGAHFATFNPDLVEFLLRASCPPKVCAECGKAWEHRVDVKSNYTQRETAHAPRSTPTKVDSTGWKTPSAQDLGYHAVCSCGGDTVPGLVLDPFLGSGTVTQVAERMGRRSIGIELQREYQSVMLERFGRPKPQEGQAALDIDAPLPDWLEFIHTESPTERKGEEEHD